MVGTDKNIKRSDIKNLDINNMILVVNINDPLRILSNILLGIVKIYIKKIKYLVDETNELLIIISDKKQKVKVQKKSVQVVDEDVYISDIIMSNIDDNIYIDDMSIEPMRDIQESVINEVVMNEGRMNEGRMNYDNVESSNIVESFSININNNLERKRKRILEDDIIEYDNKYYKDNVCSIRNNINRSDKFNIKYLLEPNIPKFFMDKLNLQREVEIMRDQTSIEQYNEISVIDNYDAINDIMVNDISINDNDKEIELENLPNEFNFNNYVSECNREDKAKYFFDLLVKASDMKICVSQENPFTSIICNIK